MRKLSIALLVVLTAGVTAASAATGETPGQLLLAIHNHLFHVFQHLMR
jgi:hypothetical protein